MWGLKEHLAMNQEYIEIYGAREHNLKNIDVRIPRDQLVVITGLSGSGKSSLAFDTLFAEGQRRYIETFSAYARQYLGGLERPDVDKIDGLSPVIAIEQKTTNKNPRSTVGTVTELYDFLRLLYARVADAYSPETGQRLTSFTEEEILDALFQQYPNERIYLLAPIVRSRKGHYQELFIHLAKKGYEMVRVDAKIQDILPDMKLDRYKTHDIEVVVDRLSIEDTEETRTRLARSLGTALDLGEGVVMVIRYGSEGYSYFSKHLMDTSSGSALPVPEPNTFSFNSPKGHCPQCKGIGSIRKVNLQALIDAPEKGAGRGAFGSLEILKENHKWLGSQIRQVVEALGAKNTIPWSELSEEIRNAVLYGIRKEIHTDLKTAGVSKKNYIHFEGLVPFLERLVAERESSDSVQAERHLTQEVMCSSCQGKRLNPQSLSFKIGGKDIAEVSSLPLREFQDWVANVPEYISPQRRPIATEILKEISTRLGFLLNVGLDYLSLNRASRTLSGGESQRIRLATQIGSQLVNVLYILDEPSIGLHQRDNDRLIQALKDLRDLGNSVLVVEHDRDMILEADYVLDVGPRAGKYGGEIVWQGTPDELKNAQTLTADYINAKREIPIPTTRREGNGKYIQLKGASGNNLKNVNLEIPLGKLVVVSGTSGSGKSSLINGTLYPILNQHIYRGVQPPLPYKSIQGLEHIDKVVDVDQSPIGRTPRSNPATYTGVFTDIRTLFTGLPEAKIRGYKPGRFSFNIKGGRCETCQGGGMKVIEMNFLPDVYVHCETCNGKRFNRETLEIRYKGKSIADVLDMTVNDAVQFFQALPKIYTKLKTLQEVGLGYITLGQASTTLSGGEAQRIKLATELAKRQTGSTLYILDEPTTGLHFEDVKILMESIQKLIDLGNTFIIIEHNMDVIKMADHLIDIGPEGGNKGGEIVSQGTPEKVAKSTKSLTAKYLRKELKQ